MQFLTRTFLGKHHLTNITFYLLKKGYLEKKLTMMDESLLLLSNALLSLKSFLSDHLLFLICLFSKIARNSYSCQILQQTLAKQLHTLANWSLANWHDGKMTGIPFPDCWHVPRQEGKHRQNNGNRPLALRGRVTSFLWKWKLHDFAFQTLLVGHLLNKIIMIWFFKPAPFA